MQVSRGDLGLNVVKRICFLKKEKQIMGFHTISIVGSMAEGGHIVVLCSRWEF